MVLAPPNGPIEVPERFKLWIGETHPSVGLYTPMSWQQQYILTTLIELDSGDNAARHHRRRPDEKWEGEGSSRTIPTEGAAFAVYSRFCDGELAALARNKSRLEEKQHKEKDREKEAAKQAEIEAQRKAAAQGSDVVMGGMD